MGPLRLDFAPQMLIVILYAVIHANVAGFAERYLRPIGIGKFVSAYVAGDFYAVEAC